MAMGDIPLNVDEVRRRQKEERKATKQQQRRVPSRQPPASASKRPLPVPAVVDPEGEDDEVPASPGMPPPPPRQPQRRSRQTTLPLLPSASATSTRRATALSLQKTSGCRRLGGSRGGDERYQFFLTTTNTRTTHMSI